MQVFGIDNFIFEQTVKICDLNILAIQEHEYMETY